MIGLQTISRRAADNGLSQAASALRGSLRSILLDQIDCGLIVCDANAELHLVNRAADDELATERVLRRSGNSLRCAALSSSALDAALRAAASKGRRQLLTLSHQGDRLMASLLPLPQDDGLPPLVLVMLGRRGPCSTLSLEMLCSAYRLTLAERRVLAALVANAQPREIAAAHGVALSTVRTQIAAVRAKFGVRTIEGLLLLAAEVPPVPSALRSSNGAGPGRRRAAYIT